MKTAVFFGSPHKEGNTAEMVRRFCTALGGTFTAFDAYGGDIGPCVDCGRCAAGAECPISDRGREALDAIREADCIVIASPIYFGDLSGPAVSMGSRLQYLWMCRRAGKDPLGDRVRQGVILLSGGGSDRGERALANARCYLHVMGASVTAQITAEHTDTLPVSADTAVLEKIRQAADRVRRGAPLCF